MGNMKTLPQSVRVVVSCRYSLFFSHVVMHTWRNTRHREKGDLILLGALIFARRKFPLPHCQNLINPMTYCNNSRIAPPTVKIGRTICQPPTRLIAIFHSSKFVIKRMAITGSYAHNYGVSFVIFFSSFARDYFRRYKFLPLSMAVLKDVKFILL